FQPTGPVQPRQDLSQPCLLRGGARSAPEQPRGGAPRGVRALASGDVAAQVPPGEGTAARAATLRAELEAALGAEALLTGDHCLPYRVDGVVPTLVAVPSSAEEVAAALAAADHLGAAVIPWGGGSAMALGYPPRAGDLALDLRRLNRVLQY